VLVFFSLYIFSIVTCIPFVAFLGNSMAWYGVRVRRPKLGSHAFRQVFTWWSEPQVIRGWMVFVFAGKKIL